MSKEKSTHKRFSLLAVISWLSFALGIGCITLAMIKIGASSVQLAGSYSGNDSSPALIADNPTGLSADITDTMEIADPSDTRRTDKILYPVYPWEGDTIGTLSIPALELESPVLQGTSEDELEKGVGHYLQSVLPGEADNCVLSGHRTTVFAKLGEIKTGDQLILQTTAGIFTYEVTGTRIVDKDDKTVIVPTDRAVLTLTTCYPFIYIGSAPDRFIVSADLVISE